MPTEWTYHADGVSTAVNVSHDMDGSLCSITVQLDSFKVREWTEDEDEIEAQGKSLQNLQYDEEKDAYVEHAGGSHATIEFDVQFYDSEGFYIADLVGIEPEDGERVQPRHMTLLPAAERIVEQIDNVEIGKNSMTELADEYEDAKDIHIERLDG